MSQVLRRAGPETLLDVLVRAAGRAGYGGEWAEPYGAGRLGLRSVPAALLDELAPADPLACDRLARRYGLDESFLWDLVREAGER